MNNLRSAVARIWFLDTTATEIWLSILSMGCGAWLLLPFDAISIPFKLFGPQAEMFVAIWLLLLGSFRLHAVYCELRTRRSTCAVMAFMTWVFLLVASLAINYKSIITVLYLLPSLMSVWVFLRTPGAKLPRRPSE